MPSRRHTSLLFLLSLIWAGCPSHTLLSVQDQESLQSTKRGAIYHLKQSFYVGPFFEYDDRLYISERGFDERILIESPKGDPIMPCQPLTILPMGTRVRIRDIEFPTGKAISERKLKSPRHFTWILLELEKGETEKPFVLVLTQQFNDQSQFEAGLKAFLVKKNPKDGFSSRLPEMLEAISRKALRKGMRADAVLRSRGYPDKITRKLVEGVTIERWQYAPERIVTLKADVVDSWEGFPEESLHPLQAPLQETDPSKSPESQPEKTETQKHSEAQKSPETPESPESDTQPSTPAE